MPTGAYLLLMSDEAQARLAAIVESSDDAIISKDLNGIVTSWNRAAERIFGYTSAEMVGQSILKIIPGDRRSEEEGILAALRRGERVDHFDTIRIARDGHEIPVSLTISPIRDLDGRVVGASKIARDISDRRRAEAEREELMESERAARTAAERANRSKDEFLATLSHELRTPLNAMLGWSQLMRTTPMDGSEITRALSAIERNVRLQSQLVDDLLDMSRIASGKMRIEIQRVNLTSVIESAIETARPAAAAKNIHLQPSLDTTAGIVSGDPVRLEQIVWNLLSNAVKFTPKGGRVQVVLERVNSHVEIRVTDTGLGIAADFLPHVFDRFRQAESSATRPFGGLGIGLALVKHIAELHGGIATVNSPGLGQGSTFTVSLPIAAAHADEDFSPQGTGDVGGGHAIDLTNVRVLVVDDDEDALSVMRRLLEAAHAQVLTARSAADALSIIEMTLPDIVISDIGMAGEDGYTLIRKIRALPPEQGGRVPAIALTAFARPEDRRRAMLAGFHLHFSKPVEVIELRAAVATLVGRSNAMAP